MVLAALLLGLILALHYANMHHQLQPQRLQQVVANAGPAAPLLYIALYSLTPVLMLPGLPVTLAGGILFGPFWGVVYAIVGATCGATLAFLTGRYLGRDWLAKRLQHSQLRHLDEQVAVHGWKVLAFTRLVPLFPFNLLNYAFGLTRIRLSTYILVSALCMLPACIAYIVFSSSLLELITGQISPTFIIGLGLILAVSLIPLWYRRRRQVPTEDPFASLE